MPRCFEAVAAQQGGSRVEHRGPRPLLPGERPGVVDVDARVHPAELVAAYGPLDVDPAQAAGGELGIGCDAVLHPSLSIQHPRRILARRWGLFVLVPRAAAG